MSDSVPIRLCDDAGWVSNERVAEPNPFDPELTYMRQLNNLRSRTPEAKPWVGDPFRCTGHAHLAGLHIMCTSPAHARSPASEGRSISTAG